MTTQCKAELDRAVRAALDKLGGLGTYDKPIEITRDNAHLVDTVVRCGLLPPIVTLHDVAEIVEPRGEVAQDVFDREMERIARDFALDMPDDDDAEW